jgi:hypothetical protein
MSINGATDTALLTLPSGEITNQESALDPCVKQCSSRDPSVHNNFDSIPYILQRRHTVLESIPYLYHICLRECYSIRLFPRTLITERLDFTPPFVKCFLYSFDQLQRPA